MFNVPTSGVIVNDTFYYVANAQFGSFNKDGSLFPMERLFEPVVLKVKLNEEARTNSRNINGSDASAPWRWGRMAISISPTATATPTGKS